MNPEVKFTIMFDTPTTLALPYVAYIDSADTVYVFKEEVGALARKALVFKADGLEMTEVGPGVMLRRADEADINYRATPWMSYICEIIDQPLYVGEQETLHFSYWDRGYAWTLMKAAVSLLFKKNCRLAITMRSPRDLASCRGAQRAAEQFDRIVSRLVVRQAQQDRARMEAERQEIEKETTQDRPVSILN